MVGWLVKVSAQRYLWMEIRCNTLNTSLVNNRNMDLIDEMGGCIEGGGGRDKNAFVKLWFAVVKYVDAKL